MSVGERLTDFTYLLISSILSVVDGKKKKTLEKSVSENAPDLYWIQYLLKIVVLKLLGIFILCVLYKILLFSLLNP